VDFPSAREAWTIDGITRDGDPARVWLHFRNPLPQAPQGRLGIRVGRRRVSKYKVQKGRKGLKDRIEGGRLIPLKVLDPSRLEGRPA
jgi:hypothetical protein